MWFDRHQKCCNTKLLAVGNVLKRVPAYLKAVLGLVPGPALEFPKGDEVRRCDASASVAAHVRSPLKKVCSGVPSAFKVVLRHMASNGSNW